MALTYNPTLPVGFLQGDNNSIVKDTSGQYDTLKGAYVPPAALVETIYKKVPIPTDTSGTDAQALRDQLNALNGTAPDQNKIYQDTMSRFQAQIDATNKVYNDQLSSARVAGAGRLGQTSAIQARRGLLGSDFGAAQTDTTTAANQDVYNAIDAQRQNAIQIILGKARDDSAAEYTAKKDAYVKNAESRIAWLEGTPARAEANARKAAASLLAQGITVDQVNPTDLDALAKYYNISVDQIKQMYGTVKSETDTAKQKTQLEMQKLAKDAAPDAQKPFTVSPGSSIYDSSGNYIGTAPEKPTDNKPVTQQVGKTLLQWDSTTGRWSSVFTEPDATKTTPPVLKEINGVTQQWNPDTGKWESPSAAVTPNTKALDAAKEKIAQIDNVLNSPGLNSAVGPNALSRIPIADAFGAKSEFLGAATQLLSQESLNTLIGAKAKGATFGALSDAEMRILSSAATKLGSWAQRDSAGNITGFNVDEGSFKKELNALKESANKILQYSQQESQQGGGNLNPDEQKKVEQMRADGLPDDVIQEVLGKPISFNQGSGDTLKLAQAVGQYESGGNYKAIGNQTASGDRAYGKYQVMGANIPAWTKEVLGKSLTTAQFLADTAAQDKVAQAKLGQYLAKFGTVEDAASTWFSGRPLAQAFGSKDVNNTSVPSYVNSVRSIYDKLA